MGKNEYEKGPYKATHTKTIKIHGPIEISIIEVDDSTHVPPAGGCGCGGGGGNLADFVTLIQQAMAASASPGVPPDSDPSAPQS